MLWGSFSSWTVLVESIAYPKVHLLILAGRGSSDTILSTTSWFWSLSLSLSYLLADTRICTSASLMTLFSVHVLCAHDITLIYSFCACAISFYVTYDNSFLQSAGTDSTVNLWLAHPPGADDSMSERYIRFLRRSYIIGCHSLYIFFSQSYWLTKATKRFTPQLVHRLWR